MWKICKIDTISKANIAWKIEKNARIHYEEKKEEEPKGSWVKSPIVGTLYSKPNESSPAYVNVGDSVNKGDIVCIIEAMKVMNEIKAPCSGKIISVAKQDGEMVQFDENLICIGD